MPFVSDEFPIVLFCGIVFISFLFPVCLGLCATFLVWRKVCLKEHRNISESVLFSLIAHCQLKSFFSVYSSVVLRVGAFVNF